MPDNRKGLTLRSVLIGLAVVAFINVWVTYAEMYVRASRMTIAHFPLALFASLLLLLGLSQVLRGLGISALSAPEYLVVLSMGFVGSVMPVEGVVGFLLHVVEGSFLNRIGYGLKEAGSDLFCGNPPSMGWQGFGAMIFMVVWGLWVARRHLGMVCHKAFCADSEVDDSGEMLSYRTAVWGGILGFLSGTHWISATHTERITPTGGRSSSMATRRRSSRTR